jgi:hypothetical protein
MDYILWLIEKLQREIGESIEVRLSGGEPFYWKFDLFALIEGLRNLNVAKITLLSTGTARQYSNVMSANVANIVDAISVTLHGNEEVHARIVSPDNLSLGHQAFANVIWLINWAVRFGKQVVIHVPAFHDDVVTVADVLEDEKVLQNTVYDTELQGVLPIKKAMKELGYDADAITAAAKTLINFVSLPDIEIRGLKVLPQGRAEEVPTIEHQLELLSRIPGITLSHSFNGECDIENKLVVLPTGRQVHCSANKCFDLGCIERRCDLFEFGCNDKTKEISY